MNNIKKSYIKECLIGGGLLLIAGTGIFVTQRYKTSKSHQWLIRTGLGIKKPQIIKNGIKWPFQNIQIADMTSSSYKVTVNAMSIEKMDMIIPAVYTIGPKNDIEIFNILIRTKS